MNAPIAGFLKVSTTDGRTFYINPHHVTAVEAVNGGTSDLVPEVNKHREFWTNLVLFVAFAGGLLTLLVIRATLGE